jgi:hypothetical protein
MLARRLGVVFFTLAAASGLGACDERWGRHGYGYPYYYDYCREYTTCGRCTPVLGCGWCGNTTNSGGYCRSDPDLCPGSSFTWTWESSGCHPSGPS